MMEILSEVYHYLSFVLVKENLSPLGSSFRSLFVSKLAVLILPVLQPISDSDLLRVTLETDLTPDIVHKFWSYSSATVDLSGDFLKADIVQKTNGVGDISANPSTSGNIENIRLTSQDIDGESAVPVLSHDFLDSLLSNDIEIDNDNEKDNLAAYDADTDEDDKPSDKTPINKATRTTRRRSKPSSENNTKTDGSEQNVAADHKEYVCLLCNKRFERKRTFISHKYTHNLKFSCSECDKKFAHSTNMKRHMRTHTGEKLFSCTHCDKHFRTKSQQQVHMRTHTKEKPFKCVGCGKGFSSGASLRHHMHPLKHNTSDDHAGELLCAQKLSEQTSAQKMKDHYECSTCNMVFQRRYNLERHLRTHARWQHALEAAELHNCRVCGIACSTENGLKTHMADHPGEKAFKCTVCDKTLINSTSLFHHMFSHTDDPDAGKKYCCHECGKRFRYSSHMKEHMMVHSGERPFRCDVCAVCFTHRSTLKAHLATHGLGEARRHCCHRCGALFAKPFHLRKHMMTVHATAAPYRCMLCNKSFKHNTYLKLHEKIHAENRVRHTCEVCEKTFIRSDSLLAHQRVHTGEKPYNCEQCGHAFVSSAALRNHVRFIHENDKPFACTECEYRCRDKNTLSKHMCKHTGEKPYGCPYCSKRFSSSSSVNTHVKTHTGEKPHSCSICSYRCIQATDLRKHMANTHSISSSANKLY